MYSLRRRKVGNYRPPRLRNTYSPCCSQLGAHTGPVPEMLLILAYFGKLELWFCVCKSLLNVQTFATTRVKGVNLPFTVGSSPKTSLPTTAEAIAFLISAVGTVTVSLLKSITGTVVEVGLSIRLLSTAPAAALLGILIMLNVGRTTWERWGTFLSSRANNRCNQSFGFAMNTT